MREAGSPESTEAKTVDRSLEAWKVAVQVQQHFNDLELRIRNYALTLLLAVLGGAGLAIQEQAEVNLFGWSTSLAVLILAAGLVGWRAFYFMDHKWYHRLLLGAVAQGMELEKFLQKDIPGIGLTTKIGEMSPYHRKWLRKETKWLRKEIHSERKITIFYGAITLLLVATMILVHIGVETNGGNDQPVPSSPTPTPIISPSPS